MDPFNMPAFGAAPNPGARLQTDIKTLAPLATTYHGAQTGVNIQQYSRTPAVTHQGVLPAFLGKVASIGKESAHIIGGAADWVFTQGADMVKSVAEFPVNTVKFGMDTYNTFAQSRQADELNGRLQSLNAQYKSGALNTKQYQQGLKEFSQDSAQLGQESKANQARISHDSGALVNDTINTAAAILTVMTAGTAGAAAEAGASSAEVAASEFLGGKAVDAALSEGENAVGKLATNKNLFSTMSSAAQNAVRKSVTQVVFNGSKDLTSAQMSRAATTNLLLNYPLTYNMLSSAGQGVYKDLQSGKYGEAVKSLAFNAALLLSGGPIGHALKYGGKAVSGVSGKIFGSTSFLDTLSGLMGNHDPAGLFNAIKDDPELTNNFAALEATNVAASSGNTTRAAYRIIDGLTNAGWGDVTTMTHEDFAKQVNNWATAQRTLTEHLIGKGMTESEATKYVVGRWTASDANSIAAQLTKEVPGLPKTPEEMLTTWEGMKQATPNASWANNENLNKEITHIINNSSNAAEVDKRVRAIDAQFGINGVSKSVSDKLAKLGYVGIEPLKLDAPFKEGGAVASEFATQAQQDFFVKTTQPLPVLGSVGNLLTAMGMSPNASGQRVYDIFTQNFAHNLSELDIAKKFVGASPEENADYFAKQLGNYVHDMKPSIKSPPVTDYRQLTLNEIQEALAISKSDAVQVRAAIMDSMLEVPLSVRGLGDKVADINYKINPFAKTFSRVQGATRFAWNPFFQAKLSYKAEFLSQLESGGKFPTLLGTNKVLQFVFPEKYKQLDSIGEMLESKGVFGAGYSAEGADEQAVGYRAIGHTLLPGQKRSVSGLVSVMAAKAGMSADDFVENFPNQTRDVVRMILQYDPKANFLNSPMARTLNYAFFPFRFNLKVSTIMARSVARQPAVVQFAVIKGMMQAHQYLNSQEGMAWYSENSDVIGLFKYFSPVAELSTIAQALGAKPGNVSAYGELGGLPFGWIPGLLSAEGLIDTSQPFVSPTTGVIAQQYVPVTMRGKAQAAIEDFVGALFTYPGATVGLPSKTKVGVSIARGLIPGGSNSDFNKVTPTNLTPQQQQFQQVVQQLHGTAPQSQAPQPLPPQTTPSVNVPPQHSSIENPPIKGQSGSSAKKKKKADFTPALLPGQSRLGSIPGST